MHVLAALVSLIERKRGNGVARIGACISDAIAML